jgi:cytochrome b561
MTTSPRYTLPAILLHWLMALLIVAAFAIGLKLWGLPLSPLKFKLIAWHKWAGITVLILLLLRIVVRATCKTPPLPAHMTRHEQRLAHAGHLLLYALMAAVPLAGWAMSSAYGIPVVYFGKLALPPLVGANPALASSLKLLHQALNALLALTVAGHVLIAFKHHFVDRDGMLERMRPGGKTSHPQKGNP